MERLPFVQPAYDSTSPELSKEQIKKYLNLVSKAKEGRAYPDQSGYHVRAVALAANGLMHAGGNKEYGLSDAFIHGETAAISGLMDETDSPIEAVAWYLEDNNQETLPQSFARPCGNCRDIMLKCCGPNLVLLTASKRGIVIANLRDFLFEKFDRKGYVDNERDAVSYAIKAAYKATDIYIPDNLKKIIYGASLVFEDGKIWSGAHYSNAGFDSITPVLSAITTWRNFYPTSLGSGSLYLSKLVIASPFGLPTPFYRDRQAILELDEILRRYTKRETPLPVQLVYARDDTYGSDVIIDARETNTEEMLPHPFTAGAFRQDDVLDAQLNKLQGRKQK